MRRLVLSILFASVLTLSASADEKKVKVLFNGKNLDGWVPVNTAESTWSVRDGMLICTGKPIGVMRSEKQYENFILVIEWRRPRTECSQKVGKDCRT